MKPKTVKGFTQLGYAMCMYYTRTYLLIPSQMFLFDWFHPQEAQASRPVPRCTYIISLCIFLFPESLHEPTSTLPCWKREERSAGCNLRLVSKIENHFWQKYIRWVEILLMTFLWKDKYLSNTTKIVCKLVASTWCFQPLSIWRCFATGILLKLNNVFSSGWLFRLWCIYRTKPCH